MRRRLFSTLVTLSFVLGSVGVLTPIVILKWKSESDEVPIRALVQEWRGPDRLTTPSLAQMLDLKLDGPTKMGEFDCDRGEEKLLGYPMFQKVSIKKSRPEGLLISYTLREPFALVGNFENVAIDREGILFPMSPFYTQKRLPTLLFDPKLFDLEDVQILGKRIPKREMELAKDLIDLLPGDIDLSRIDKTSYGGREVVIKTSDHAILRLTTRNYPQELANYFSLRHQGFVFHEGERVIVDLRIPGVAYIGRYGEKTLHTDLLDSRES